MQELAVENWIINNLEKVFPKMTLVSSNEILSNRFEVDLHLKDEDRNDVFIEIKSKGLKPRDVGTLLNYYSILSNLDNKQHIRFIVLTPEISEDTRNILNNFGVETRLFSDLSMGDNKIPDFNLRELRNVLTPLESEALAYINEKKCNIIDVEELSQQFNYASSYASKILERLEKKEYLERIKRGKYLFIPLDYGYDERYSPMNLLIVGSVLAEPYYYSYQTANSFHGYTTQFSPITYICTTKLKRKFRWKNIRYKFVNLVEEKFFGFEKKLSDGCEIFVAEPEKAVLDSLDKPDYCGGIAQVVAVVANAFTKGLDDTKLFNYAVRFDSNSVIQRLGYVTEFLHETEILENDDKFIGVIENLLPKNASNTFLGSVGKYGRKGSINDRWHIIENFEVKSLLDEIDVR